MDAGSRAETWLGSVKGSVGRVRCGLQVVPLWNLDERRLRWLVAWLIVSSVLVKQSPKFALSFALRATEHWDESRSPNHLICVAQDLRRDEGLWFSTVTLTQNHGFRLFPGIDFSRHLLCEQRSDMNHTYTHVRTRTSRHCLEQVNTNLLANLIRSLSSFRRLSSRRNYELILS